MRSELLPPTKSRPWGRLFRARRNGLLLGLGGRGRGAAAAGRRGDRGRLGGLGGAGGRRRRGRDGRGGAAARRRRGGRFGGLHLDLGRGRGGGGDFGLGAADHAKGEEGGEDVRRFHCSNSFSGWLFECAAMAAPGYAVPWMHYVGSGSRGVSQRRIIRNSLRCIKVPAWWPKPRAPRAPRSRRSAG